MHFRNLHRQTSGVLYCVAWLQFFSRFSWPFQRTIWSFCFFIVFRYGSLLLFMIIVPKRSLIKRRASWAPPQNFRDFDSAQLCSIDIGVIRNLRIIWHLESSTSESCSQELIGSMQKNRNFVEYNKFIFKLSNGHHFHVEFLLRRFPYFSALLYSNQASNYKTLVLCWSATLTYALDRLHSQACPILHQIPYQIYRMLIGQELNITICHKSRSNLN